DQTESAAAKAPHHAGHAVAVSGADMVHFADTGAVEPRRRTRWLLSAGSMKHDQLRRRRRALHLSARQAAGVRYYQHRVGLPMAPLRPRTRGFVCYQNQVVVLRL